MKNYNVKKIEVSYKPISLSFEEITLLSKEEYFENEDLIPPSKDIWWLRSPGDNDVKVAFARSESGGIYDYGQYIGGECGVRPALKIQDCHDLIPGDKIRISGYVFTILHGNLALCDTCIKKKIFDYKSNCFKTSLIKRYLYNWAEENDIVFERKMEGISQIDIHNLLSWMVKYCRHIDNIDKPLTDEENLDFFRRKIKEQFNFDICEVIK